MPSPQEGSSVHVKVHTQTQFCLAERSFLSHSLLLAFFWFHLHLLTLFSNQAFSRTGHSSIANNCIFRRLIIDHEPPRWYEHHDQSTKRARVVIVITDVFQAIDEVTGTASDLQTGGKDQVKNAAEVCRSVL